MDHEYNLSAKEASDEEDLVDLEDIQTSSKEEKINWVHTPTKSLNSKKKRGAEAQNMEEENTVAVILKAIVLSQKMDEQTELLKKLDKRIDTNTAEMKKNQEGIAKLKVKMDELQKENKSLRSLCEDHAHYSGIWGWLVC